MLLKTWSIVLACCITVCSASPELLDRFQRAPRVKRVIGGHDVTEGAWPWLAHLTGKVPFRYFWGIPTGYKYYYCGGAIVSKRWILTAAHCLKAKGAPLKINLPKHWHIKLGEVDIRHTVWDNVRDWMCRIGMRNDCQLWYEHAEKIIVHPGYNDQNGALWKNDIAMIKVNKDLPVDGTHPNIATTTLAEPGDMDWPQAGTECIMKGWGCTSKGGPISKMAKQVPLPAQRNGLCDALFGEISLSRVCAGETLEGKGLCAGDSGGPLVCKKDDTWVQAGIASFTSASNPGQVPGVFTRVAYYRDWINRVIRDE